MAAKLGGDRVQFFKGHIQDLALDLEALDRRLAEHPVNSAQDYQELETWQDRARHEHPLVADQSVDLVISNCVLNLVHQDQRQQLIQEIYRVLKPGGRVAISDIVADEPVPAQLQSNPELWSGCVSGAFQEEAFVQAFSEAGFRALCYDKWEAEPWQVIEDIEFRSVTLTAVKGEEVPCVDYGHAIIYRGPYAEVRDDEDHIYPRGARMAVCERTYHLLTEGPYGQDFIGIAPSQPGAGTPWCAPTGTRRAPSESKGASHSRRITKERGCC
jgi:SAM-dependent methyltransferase